tara:strand:+ start:192 stop:497 length:306 start_codon:yes stop_codon:yes gene_type:complete
MDKNRIKKEYRNWVAHNKRYPMPEGNVIASTALQFRGELKKGKLIFRVRIWIEAIGSTPERWFDDFPEGFTHYWDFDNLREAINFQRNFSAKWGLPDPLEG